LTVPRETADFPGSTAIARVAFTPQDDIEGDEDPAGILDITFTSGRTFSFENVPRKVFEGLRDADSPGSFFHANIKGAY
jgi:hypothetical protein